MEVLEAILLSLCFATVTNGFRIETKTYEDFPDKCNNRDMNPFIPIGKNYYYVSGQKMSWFAAAHYCLTLNSDLATIKSDEEMNAIQSYLDHKGFTDYIWVGGNDLTTVFDFQWISNGQPMTYSKWTKGEPNNQNGKERCVLLWRIGAEYQMNDAPCDDKFYFLCQANIPKTVAVTVF